MERPDEWSHYKALKGAELSEAHNIQGNGPWAILLREYMEEGVPVSEASDRVLNPTMLCGSAALANAGCMVRTATNFIGQQDISEV